MPLTFFMERRGNLRYSGNWHDLVLILALPSRPRFS
jgi:hypothetical protein